MIISDPIHHSILIYDNDIKELVGTRFFQRLKGLKQQGNTYFLYPNAKHNRLSHSLGVYANMQRIINHLVSKGIIHLTDYQIKIALVSSLLHDIGHGAFSHCFEHITGIDHEDLTIRIIQEDEEIDKILSKTVGLKNDVISVLNKKGDFPIIEGILKSKVSADSLDYNARDFLYSGLDLPPFDPAVIIDHLDIYKNSLVIKEDALSEIEKLYIIKKHLFENVFCHPYVLGKDTLLKVIFKRASLLHQQGQLNSIPLPVKFILNNDFKWEIKSYLEVDDFFMVNLIEEWKHTGDNILTLLCSKYTDNKMDSNIKWLIIDSRILHMVKELLNRTENEEYNVQLYSRNPAYGYYKEGLLIKRKTDVIDIIHKSKVMREISNYRENQHFVFYVEETDLVKKIKSMLL